ncbi:polysaccharide biosynthesis protein [Candidatus Pseudothioglobus singularis]|nr:polysaccharide biosynthesis protein [Candidatus Pseudothioglobus singularis]
MMFVDSVLVVSVLFCSFSIRLGYWYWPKDEMVWIIFGAPFIAIPVFISSRLYYSVVRYIGNQALWTMAQAATLYSIAWGLLSYMAAIGGIPGVYGIPRSVILINWMLAIIVIGGLRILARWLFTNKNLFSEEKTNVIVYGAGSAGRQLSHSLMSSGEYEHIAYIDDNLGKDRAYINNIPVFVYEKIQSIVEKNNVTEVLLALPSISRKKQYEIIEKLRPFSVHVRSLPSVSELAGGKVKIDDLLEIDVDDLLGRETVAPNEKLLQIKVTDKTVLVTGAGGSIGSELCRQILFLKPKQLILFEVSEASLYLIDQELADINTLNVEVYPVIGSVQDYKRMTKIFNYYKVQTIYHAAAYKHVPLVEYNQSQGVLNNAIGTKLAAEAAIAEKVETFVLISTDKAVRPTNTMGATKRVAELTLQALAKQTHNTCLTMVRFGNVLGSSGSVIPLFKKQIKHGGPITVTDSNIVRYFMTIPEAVELVIQAGAMGQGGDVFVLDMGSPVKIYDLAVKMIQLSGLHVMDADNPEGDIEIKYTGLRPGEKLYEELLVDTDATKTENKLIMRAKEKMIPWESLKPALEELKEESKNSNLKKIQELLVQIVPEFKLNIHSKD